MNSKFEALKNLGAGEFEHLNGSLIEHLNGTYNLLKSWNAPQFLCDAGLYHAAYGTDGYNEKVVSLSYRDKIASIIGNDAEEIVYLYCACDRDFVFSNVGKCEQLQFKDRFTSKAFALSDQQAKNFCELTVANELELALSSESFKNKHGKALHELFIRFTPYLSQQAITENIKVLGKF